MERGSIGEPLHTSSELQLRPQMLIDAHYRLERCLSRGSSSCLWEAENVRLGGRVAIKFLTHEVAADERGRARFLREARTIGQVRSPHVVQVQDQGVVDGLPFMVMELLDGEDLARLLERRNRLTLTETAGVLDQLARGLGKLHRAGFVHRDLRPENVFVIHEDDGRFFVKLLGFGIVKPLRSTTLALTRTDTLVGAPGYSSPEQIERPHDVDQRADVWAFGVLAYRMLLGRLPFEARSAAEVLDRIVTGRYDRASVVDPVLPAALDAWFARALAGRTSHRFQTAAAASAALQSIAHDTAASGAGRDGPPAGSPDVIDLPYTGPRRWLQHRSVRSLALLALLAFAGLIVARLVPRSSSNDPAPAPSPSTPSLAPSVLGGETATTRPRTTPPAPDRSPAIAPATQTPLRSDSQQSAEASLAAQGAPLARPPQSASRRARPRSSPSPESRAPDELKRPPYWGF